MSLNPFSAITSLATSRLAQTPFGQAVGLGGPVTPAQAPAQASPSPITPAVQTAAMQPALNSGKMETPDLRTGIQEAALALGIDPLDLATAISYETGGTFDPTKMGPTTQWGQHRGLIQFGEPQAKKYGVDWNNAIGSQLGPDGAIVKYLKDAGVKPGMGLLDVYSAINAGSVGRYGASDANNGGAPGTVADKVNSMSEHKAKAAAFLGGSYAPAMAKAQSPYERVWAMVQGGAPQSASQPAASGQGGQTPAQAPSTFERVLAMAKSRPTSQQQVQAPQIAPSETNSQEVAFRKQQLEKAAQVGYNQPSQKAASRKAELRKKIGLGDRA